MDIEYECSPGEIIIEQGEAGRGFFILRSGTVEVYKDNLLLSVLQFPGTVFGEMADILGSERTCSIQAKTHCKLLHIDESNIQQLICERPEIAVRIIKTLARRLEKTTQKLTEQYAEPQVWSVAPFNSDDEDNE